MLTKSKEERIEELEGLLFQIDMVDRWSTEQTELYNKYSQELKKLKEELENE